MCAFNTNTYPVSTRDPSNADNRREGRCRELLNRLFSVTEDALADRIDETKRDH